MSGARIAQVEVVQQTETQGIGDRAIAQVPGQIVEKQSADVDAVAGATITSKAIMTAVKEALTKAK
jgi:uncharacterized protein with FMN-binding domain